VGDLVVNLMQSKFHSFIESLMNQTIGYILALITQVIVFSFYNITVSLSQNLQITLIFAIISILRSYIIRRIFNKINVKMQS
jgi:hypothetical protein